MRFKIITIFPEIFDSYFNESIIKRAQEKKIIKIEAYDLRKWTIDKHKTVDDSPYGGGAGMVMKVDVLYSAIKAVRPKKGKNKIVLLSAKGKTWNQKMVKEYAKLDEVVMICGRYEGVDERVLEFVDEEISIGDYVLTGGELGVMTMVDSIARLLPGVLGNEESAEKESHSKKGVLEHPHYTRPEIFRARDFKTGKKRTYKVPDVLLSGDHKKIEEWRGDKMKKR